jgi:antitoxin component of MazEF toxin-antitoxin module
MAHSVTLTQWSNDNGIQLPQALCQQLGIQVGQKVEIATSAAGEIIIRPNRSKYNRSTQQVTIKELFQNYQGTHQSKEPDWSHFASEKSGQ